MGPWPQMLLSKPVSGLHPLSVFCGPDRCAADGRLCDWGPQECASGPGGCCRPWVRVPGPAPTRGLVFPVTRGPQTWGRAQGWPHIRLTGPGVGARAPKTLPDLSPARVVSYATGWLAVGDHPRLSGRNVRSVSTEREGEGVLLLFPTTLSSLSRHLQLNRRSRPLKARRRLDSPAREAACRIPSSPDAATARLATATQRRRDVMLAVSLLRDWSTPAVPPTIRPPGAAHRAPTPLPHRNWDLLTSP